MPNIPGLPNFSDNDLLESNPEKTPEIANGFSNVLSYLLSRDPASNRWRLVASDASGRLLVSMAGVGKSSLSVVKTTLPSSETLIVGSNTNRIGFFLHNGASSAIQIGLVQGQTAVNYLLIPAGYNINIDSYVGPIYGIGNATPIEYVEY